MTKHLNTMATRRVVALGIAGVVFGVALNARAVEDHWGTTWGCAPQLTEPGNLPPAPLANATLRQFMRNSIGGKLARVRLSNAYGTDPVTPGVTDTNLPSAAMREIWKGFTTNHGAPFTRTPLTRNSGRDNFRPIVPVWNKDNIALLWFRSTYNSAQSFASAIVGLIEQRAEGRDLMTNVDATTSNTTLANGSELVTGGGVGQWHLRPTTGNGGSVLASADVAAEDAPTLRTTVPVPAPGAYDVWVNFWGNPTASDWRIKAGLTANKMQVFRQMACQSVEPGAHDSSLLLTNDSTNFLYRAYVGRITASTSNTVGVFVDDHAITTGSTSTLAGDINRTGYDGVSYAKVETAPPLRIQSVAKSVPTSFTLTWNSLPPDSLLPQTFTVRRKSALADANWTTLATDIPSASSTTTFTDISASAAAAYYQVISP